MDRYTIQLCDQKTDRNAVVDLLFALKEELLLDDRSTAEDVADRCFENGGVFGAYDEGKRLIGMCGFFYGEPDHDFRNKDVVFMYVAGILPEYRLSRVFHHGLIEMLQAFKEDGHHEIRLQAQATNPYTNGLYSRFAAKVGEGRSHLGRSVNTYGGTIDNALWYLRHGRRRSRQTVTSVGALVAA